MAKNVCKNCGTKNPSSAAVCVNCGSFLIDDQSSQSRPAAPAPTVTPPSSEPEASPAFSEAPTQTIRVAIKGSTYTWVPLIISVAILAVFIILQYTITLPTYAFLIFLFLILILPTVFRRGSMGVRYTTTGFSFPGNENMETFQYNDIQSVQIGHYDRYSQDLTLIFSTQHSPVKVEFNYFPAFRAMVSNLGRRRIQIVNSQRTAQQASSDTGNEQQ